MIRPSPQINATGSRHLLPVLALLAFTSPLAAQTPIEPEGTRREYFTPGLVVETGARRGACDVILFTNDGNHLMAVGDDKEVRCWKLGPNKALLPAEVPSLRWRTWHEALGNIYACALSPDQRLVAIAGQGMSVGALAVLDRTDGSTRFAFPGDQSIRHGVVWSMAFSPTGKQVAYGARDGSVWLWDLQEGKQTTPRLLGQHDVTKDKAVNYSFVRLVKYLDAGRVLSVVENGQAMLWQIPAGGQAAAGRELFRFTPPGLYRIAASPDGKWVAGASDVPGHRYVELCSLPDGAKRKRLEMPVGEFPHSLAFSADGARLAVGIRRVAQPQEDERNPFFKETGAQIYVYDLTAENPKATPGPVPTFNPEAMAFHPTGHSLLAVAGGDDHEVTLWDLNNLKKVSEVRGPGNGLWAVALSSPDARYLGFKAQRNRDPSSPNDRGAGPWKVFDLENRRWATGIDLKVPANRDEEGGWRVRTGLSKAEGEAQGIPEEERQNTYIWFVQNKQGRIFKLPLVTRQDYLPRCYAFIPAGKGRPVRLVVGHLWGLTVFDLTDAGPKRVRYLSGHEGEVMGLAVSADGKRLVSVSRDETVSGWALEDWPHHAELGARFLIREGRLLARDVTAGSPVWELGLDPGDEVSLLAVTPPLGKPKLLYSRVKQYGDVGTPDAALSAIESAGAGEELYFFWTRARDSKLLQASMTVKQRPLWRFYPTRDGEWVLWRWRDYYYDTSTNGDSLIGWVRSYKDPMRRPDFYRAEQFRKEFHRPDLIAATLRDWKAPEKEMKFLDFEPPEVTLKPSAERVKNDDLSVTLTAVPRGTGENHKVVRVLLWVNDYQFAEWVTPRELGLDGQGVFRQKVTIPRTVLRAGANLVVLQAYNHGAARGEVKPVSVVYDRPPPDATLYGFFVGVSDYRKSKPELAALRAREDAEAMYRLWQRRSAPLYKNVQLAAPLLDANVTRAKILAQLAALQGKVQPDDRLVLHIGGHGARPQELVELLKVDKRQVAGLDSFLYCCADFDKDRPAATTVGFEELYKVLVKLPCHKVILLDTCHSGDVRSGVESTASNPIRILTRDGVGPIILAACQPDESAYEDDSVDLARAYGLFTISIRRTLEESFATADANKNGALEARELVGRVTHELRELVDQLRQENVLDGKAQQSPMVFLPALASELPLLRRDPGK